MKRLRESGKDNSEIGKDLKTREFFTSLLERAKDLLVKFEQKTAKSIYNSVKETLKCCKEVLADL